MKRPPSKDKDMNAYADFLEGKLKVLEDQVQEILSDPSFDLYLATKKTITFWSQELAEKEVSILDAKNKEVFDMTIKFFDKVSLYNKTISDIHKMLTADQKKEAEKALAASAGIAETLAGKHNAKQN
jgi:hypothetical protein